MEKEKDIISPSMEDYLERIYMTQQEKGVVRVKDIAKLMKVRMPSVNNAIAMLKKYNYVSQEPYGYIEITDEGKVVAQKILNRHNVLTKVLQTMGISHDIAEKDACCMEHILSEETFCKIQEYFKDELAAD